MSRCRRGSGPGVAIRCPHPKARDSGKSYGNVMHPDVAFERVAPVISVRDLDAALAHYRRLGFDVDLDVPSGHKQARTANSQIPSTRPTASASSDTAT
jgi:hypothetical protein